MQTDPDGSSEPKSGSDNPAHRWLVNDAKRRADQMGQVAPGVRAVEDLAAQVAGRQDRPASSPFADDGQGGISSGEIDASFPPLQPLPALGAKADPRLPEFVPWEIDLAQFSEVPVSTVLRTLEILGLRLEPVRVRVVRR